MILYNDDGSWRANETFVSYCWVSEEKNKTEHLIGLYHTQFFTLTSYSTIFFHIPQ